MKKVAVFDFDDTLIVGDSLFPFMRYSAGRIPLSFALGVGAVYYSLRRLCGKPLPVGIRTFLKGWFLRRFMKGKKPEDLTPAIARTLAWRKLNTPILQDLLSLRDSGATIVIASGSLSLYLPALLHDIPHDVLLCTDVGVKDGTIVGDMPNGNCVSLRKAERVKEWLDANGPFEESWGYGNYPPDVPMLALVHRQIIVS